jgi:hypothetical protein
MSLFGSFTSSLLLPVGAGAGVSMISRLGSSLGAVIFCALGLGADGGTGFGISISSTAGRITSSMGMWTGVAGTARVIKVAAGIATMWTSNDTAKHEYNLRSFIENAKYQPGIKFFKSYWVWKNHMIFEMLSGDQWSCAIGG